MSKSQPTMSIQEATVEEATGQLTLTHMRTALLHQYQSLRQNSLTLANPLSPEDWMVQSMEDASPTKWHLAHTSWFFETFILQLFDKKYQLFDESFGYFFNSYYQQIGKMQKRSERGLLSKPSAQQVKDYRCHVDQAMQKLIENVDKDLLPRIKELINLGCAHEEQHQELIQTDILHGFYQNQTLPAAYKSSEEKFLKCVDSQDERSDKGSVNKHSADPLWISFPGGMVETGADENEFAFDNEYPKHKYYLNPFELLSRPVSNRDYIEFIKDGGYRDAKYWLADGWAYARAHDWQAPLYWRMGSDGHYYQFTLFGERRVNLDEAVRHVSYYEAFAYASWADAWLPTETEWEVAAEQYCQHQLGNGHFLVNGQPTPYNEKNLPNDMGHTGKNTCDEKLHDMYGGVWEWTQSPYTPYPGYKPAAGAIGEYNGKFMSSQMVLRGGSCATPSGHVRASYRNFFPPHVRWQFSGFRLAR